MNDRTIRVYVPPDLSCSSKTSRFCTASTGKEVARAECYRCGLRVCRRCSSLRVLPTAEGRGRIRICDNCLEQEDDGEVAVMLRQYRDAGYKVTREFVRRAMDGTGPYYPTDSRVAP